MAWRRTGDKPLSVYTNDGLMQRRVYTSHSLDELIEPLSRET